MTTILPDKILLANQTKESLMHERGPLKSMSGTFAPQKGLGQTTQIIVNLRHHLANGGGIIALGMVRLTHKRRSQRRSGGRRGPPGANPCHNGKVYCISCRGVQPELIAQRIDALLHLYSASHHNRVDTGILAVWTGPPIQDGRFYTCTGVSASLNLSLTMIQKDYGAYVAASLGQELLSGRFTHEAVTRVVRVEVK